jgi:hypothetical protein
MLADLAEDIRKSPEHRIGLLLTASVRAEAEAIVAAADDALQPAEPDTVRRWLLALGPLVAGSMPLAEVQTKLAGYVAVIDAPAPCFTKRTLQAAALRFKWFPSVAELGELFAEVTLPIRSSRSDALRVLQGPAAPKGLRKAVDDEAFKRFERQWAEFKAQSAERERAMHKEVD